MTLLCNVLRYRHHSSQSRIVEEVRVEVGAPKTATYVFLEVYVGRTQSNETMGNVGESIE
jgi:hypothetical protein